MNLKQIFEAERSKAAAKKTEVMNFMSGLIAQINKDPDIKRLPLR